MKFVTALLAILISPVSERGTTNKPIKMVSGANFLVSAPTEGLANAVLSRAELDRKQIAKEWLGRELPLSIGHTVLDVFLSDTESSGLTSPSRSEEQPTFMMWITVTDSKDIDPILAHEVTHVVLLSRFPGKVPPWIDEGIACRYDDAESKAIRKDVIKWYRDTGNWPSLNDTILLERISRWDHASFAIAESVIEFLLTIGKKEQLLAATVEAHDKGWDNALRLHYKLDGVSGLDKAWKAWIKEQK